MLLELLESNGFPVSSKLFHPFPTDFGLMAWPLKRKCSFPQVCLGWWRELCMSQASGLKFAGLGPHFFHGYLI